MAGSGPSFTPPSSGRSGSGNFGTIDDSCDISVVTSLSNVQTSAFKGLDVGVDLDIELLQLGNSSRIVCKNSTTNDVVGVILSRVAPSLSRCIALGNRYTAKIVKFDYGLIEVFIRRRP